MSPQDTREKLIESTIAVIANEGLDKTTTKAITVGTGINEAYIYRHFSHKEDLLSKAFDKLDSELMSQLIMHISVMNINSGDFEKGCRLYFSKIWEFFLDNKERCLAFVRYYYSPYFVKYSNSTHKQRYEPFVERIGPAFKKGANVWMILNHILNVMLDFAVKVHNGEIPRDDDHSEHIFRVVYRSVEQYFNLTEENNY